MKQRSGEPIARKRTGRILVPASCRPGANPLRVLLIAEACNPEWTSVPLLAYYWYRALRKRANITLVTQVRNKAAFERSGRADGVVFIDSEKAAAPLHRLGRIVTLGHASALGTRNAISWPAYLYFEHLLWRRFRRRILRGDFDVIHRLTPLSPTYPSPIALKTSVPFVLGPLNGSLPWAPGTESIRAQEGEWLSPVRGIYRSFPFWRQTFNGAALIIVGAKHVCADLPYSARRRCVVLAENGVDTSRFAPDPTNPISQRRPFTILFVGRLIPLKQPSLIVDAVARMNVPAREVRIVYLGSGPHEQVIRKRVHELGLACRVDLLGSVPQRDLVRYYRSASILALPSVHESGGSVLLEAMACGLPCIVVDYGGPSEYVSKETGIKIPLASYDQMVSGFARAFGRFLEKPDLLDACSHSARLQMDRHYAWDVKATHMVHLYDSVKAAEQAETPQRGGWQ